MADAVVLNGPLNGEQFTEGNLDDYPYNEELDPIENGHHMAADNGVHPQDVLHSEPFHAGVQDVLSEQFQASFNATTILDMSTTSQHQNLGRAVGPVVPVGDIRGSDTLNYRKGEKVLRGKLASTHRLVDLYGWSYGTNNSIVARLGADVDQYLTAPQGMMYDEVTAASLVKVDGQGHVLDSGFTSLGVSGNAVQLHAAVQAARPDVTCTIHIATPPAVSVSSMKCGLLPLCQESMVLGTISYFEYFGSISKPDDINAIKQTFASPSKVLFLRNFGVVAAGESVEEAFHIANNLMTAIDTQLNLIPVGVKNLFIPSAETIHLAYHSARQTPPGVGTARQWRYGEVEFEALMRQLDNAGYRTGHVYRDTAASQHRNRSASVADVSTKSHDGSGDARDTLQHMLLNKKNSRPEFVLSPNTYHRQELDESIGPNPKKITRWTSEVGVGKQKHTPHKDENKFKYAPQGNNPHELKDKVKKIRKEYYEDAISAGPQSTILEGVTWEEAQRIKEGQSIGGVDNVLVTAASRGIIQREHQPRALFYKNYCLTNPFEKMTAEDLEQYKRDVEKKNKKGRGGGDRYATDTELDYDIGSRSITPHRPASQQQQYRRGFDTDDETFHTSYQAQSQPSYRATETDRRPKMESTTSGRSPEPRSPQTPSSGPFSPSSGLLTPDSEPEMHASDNEAAKKSTERSKSSLEGTLERSGKEGDEPGKEKKKKKRFSFSFSKKDKEKKQ